MHDLARAQRLGARTLEQLEQLVRLDLAGPDGGRARFHVVGDRAERLVDLVRQPGREPLHRGDPQHVRELGLLLP